VVAYEDVDLEGDIDAQDRKRTFDEAFDDGSDGGDIRSKRILIGNALPIFDR